RDAKSPTNSPISLTLTGFPSAPTPNATPTIAALLEQLLPLVSHIPLSLDVLNTTSMAPYSEASRDDLNAGRLQLPSGSLVIFDERVEEGKLIERGVENTGNQSGLKAAPALAEHVQEMFVRDRQAERASGGRKDDTSAADEYGLRMRLSKTMALALGLAEITCDAFDRVVDLDKRRIQRVGEIPLGSGPAQPPS
ncbi:hypothetical protein FRC06_001372, partial [Ceratobasidium sp. 370]